MNVVKGLIYLAFPAFAQRKLRMLTHQWANRVVLGGIIFLILAALLGYHVWIAA